MGDGFDWADTQEAGYFLDGESVAVEHKARMKRVSTIITSVSNFSVQFNIQALSLALLIMSASVCTEDDDACKYV